MPSEKLLFVEARRTVPVVAGSKSALTLWIIFVGYESACHYIRKSADRKLTAL